MYRWKRPRGAGAPEQGQGDPRDGRVLQLVRDGRYMIRSSTPNALCALRYQYPDDPKDLGTTLSAAQYVEDVEEDPVIIINGLTKGWRYVAIWLYQTGSLTGL
jgi:hypothetical protein